MMQVEVITKSSTYVCAWCMGLFDRETNKLIRYLSAEEFSNQSHTCCPGCKHNLFAAEAITARDGNAVEHNTVTL